MNKETFINLLAEYLSYPKNKCIIINEILENNFFISKSNKHKIIEQLTYKLNITNEEAEKIYSVSIKLITNEIKDKLKHPFRNQN